MTALPPPSPPPVSPTSAEKRRTKLTWAQLVRLEGIFALTWYPSWAEKDALAREFDLEHQQINVWFCNRRTKAKREKEHMPDSFIPSHAQAALKSKRAARPQPSSVPEMRDPSPASSRSRSRASSTGPDPRPPVALPPIRTADDDERRAPAPAPAPVSASSAASIQAQLSSSLSAALLGSSSAAYRTPYVARTESHDRSPSPVSAPAHHAPRHRSNSAGARHSPYAARQHTYPFTHRARSRSGSPPPPTLAPIGRPDYAQALPPFHTAAGLPPALPAPPNTKPHDPYAARYGPDPQVTSPAALSPAEDPRKAMLAQPIQAPPHVGALQSAPHVGAFHSMPVVGVFQGTAPPPTELPISVWQAHPLVRTRARITREQLRALEALFAKTWFPTGQQRAEAASVTGMREYSVTVWFQNRRSKAKKEGLQPPEGDRSKLRKDKGPKRDLGTHVFEVGSSRHPEPMGTGTSYPPAAPAAATPTQNLVWLEDARSRGRAPVMKTNGPQQGYTDNAPDRPGSPRSWTDAEAEAESDAEMESEAETRPRGSSQPQPQYQLREDSSRGPPGYGRAYTQYPPREGQPQPSYPPREAHPSYASVKDTGSRLERTARRKSASASASPRSTPSTQHIATLTRSASPQSISKTHSSYPHSSEPRRRNSAHSHHPESEEDAPGSDLAREDDPESESDRPTKRSRRENEHADEDVGSKADSVRHRSSPGHDQTTA